MDSKVSDIQTLRRILALARPYRWLFRSSILLALVLAPVAVARPHLVSRIVDEHIMNYDVSGMQRMVMLLIGFIMLEAMLRYAFIYGTNLLGQSVIRDLRVRTFDHVTGLRMRYFDQTPIGRSTTRTINDIETINSVFTQGIINIAADIISIIVVIGIMFWTSWRLTLIVLCTMPLLIIATYIFKEKVKVSFQRVRNEISNMNAFLQERISGMRVVQIFNAEKQESAKFKKINKSYTGANLNAITYYAIFFPVVEIIQYSAIAGMVWWGASNYLQGYVSLGALIAFPLYVSMLFRPIRMLADKFNTLQMGLVAGARVFKLLDSEDQIADDGTVEADHLRGELEFNQVRFSYDGTQEVLRDVSWTLQPGQTLAVVGSTGSGKTTLINLLYRFYDISSGQILLDGRDIQSYDLESLRARMALVLQDIALFTGTVYENITLRNARIPEERVIRAARQIGAHPFIEDLPGGYDYPVTERGENLSTGQRQLIAFVRALVYEPDILILDEATSSIDVHTESIIQHAIEKLIDRRTSIVIAHRLSTILHADRILVMSKGEVAEYGTHDELIQIEHGIYARMYALQFEREQAEALSN